MALKIKKFQPEDKKFSEIPTPGANFISKIPTPGANFISEIPTLAQGGWWGKELNAPLVQKYVPLVVDEFLLGHSVTQLG